MVVPSPFVECISPSVSSSCFASCIAFHSWNIRWPFSLIVGYARTSGRMHGAIDSMMCYGIPELLMGYRMRDMWNQFCRFRYSSRQTKIGNPEKP